MDIKCLDACKQELGPGMFQTYPKGWSGDVPDKIALKWIREGKAARLSGTPSVVAAVAIPEKGVEHGAIGEDDGTDDDDEDVDPETGEIRDPESKPSVDFASMTVAELRVVASERQIAGFARMNKASLVAALSG